MVSWIIAVSVTVVVGIACWNLYRKKIQLENYWDIEIGMPESEMLKIMGNGYNRSLLKNNRVKYEWRINATSYGSGNTRSYSGIKKVTIYTKDGYVEEVKPYNI